MTVPYEVSGASAGEDQDSIMPIPLRRPFPGPLQVVRTAGGDAARAQRIIRFLGVEHSEPAIRAYRIRATLHRASVLASAMPWAREAYIVARDAAQDPSVGLDGLRRSLEGVMVLAASGRAPELHDLAREELGASYSIVR